MNVAHLVYLFLGILKLWFCDSDIIDVFACILFDCILLFLLFIFCSALDANTAIYKALLRILLSLLCVVDEQPKCFPGN